ncbi:WD40 repeat-like protein [Gyrodon lividus]|nr:WD40 repeat-like protein [Gyrodon lividus]
MNVDESPQGSHLTYQLNIASSITLGSLCEASPSTAITQNWKRRKLSNVWARCLDRVNTLGNEDYGHTGCVNALSWAHNGELLLSSGDDQNLRVWRMDHSSSDPTNEYPFACQTVINTGHSDNVFNAQMLASSTRIATVAGDKQVRVFDVGESVGRSPTGNEMSYTTRQACIRILHCHSRRTKRIISEDNPDFFLTVAEDGEVRQHDLRTPHSCARGSCPAPLVKLPHKLSTIALSPLAPYQFVVGGESPFAHLFDRRHSGRYLREEWGMSPAVEDMTTCVRRFSRHSRAPGEAKGYEHITGARMSAWNGHEVPFNSDAVYLFSTRDEPGTGSMVRKSSVRGTDTRDEEDQGSSDYRLRDIFEDLVEDGRTEMDVDDEPIDSDELEQGEEEVGGNGDDGRGIYGADVHAHAPVIYPRIRFSGHCNVETVKDVNFLGPYDEYVASGSDDGNFFTWKKSSGEVVDVLEGDDTVVNVIEGHPTLPLVAVSGIDTTIKLFAPARGPAAYSRSRNTMSIIERNARASRRGMNHTAYMQLSHLVMRHDRALEALRNTENGGAVDPDPEAQLAQCINQ